MANEAIKVVAQEALKAAGYAADAITEAMLREKLEEITQDIPDSGPDGLRRFVEQNNDTLSRQLQPSEIGHFNNFLEDLNLTPLTPASPNNSTLFQWPEFRIPVPDFQMPRIIPEFRMPSIPNMIPGLRSQIDTHGESDTRFA